MKILAGRQYTDPWDKFIGKDVWVHVWRSTWGSVEDYWVKIIDKYELTSHGHTYTFYNYERVLKVPAEPDDVLECSDDHLGTLIMPLDVLTSDEVFGSEDL